LNIYQIDILYLIIYFINMTLQQLQYVVALDTHRHFVKAAEHCHVAQPTLTLQLRKLEEELSTVLFDRSRQPLEPTPFGRVFVSRARDLLHQADELRAMARDERESMQGTFRLGVIPTLSPNLLPLFVADFLSRHAQTRLSIEELQSQAIIDRLNHKELDFGIFATPLGEKDLREIPLFYEPFLIYASEDHPLLAQGTAEVNELKAEGLWLLRKGHCFRNQTLNICNFDREGPTRSLIMEGGSIETLKRMIDRVSGYTLIPELSYQPQDEPHIARFREPQPVREISLVVHKHYTRERLLSELRDSIVSSIPASFRTSGNPWKIRWR